MTVIDFRAFIDRLASVSGETILPFFRTSLSVDNKSASDFDPVTEADRAAEAVMRRLIKATFPQHGIVGEEFGNEREDAEYVWVLDPIDGTKSFIAGFPIWGTLIALLHRGMPVFGMMHQPYIGERFWGDSGSAEYSGPSGGRRLTVRRCAALQEAAVYTTSPLLMNAVDRSAFGRVRKRRASDPLWRRLLFLLHACGRSPRPGDRDRTETVRHRGADSDHHRSRWRGHHLERRACAERRSDHRGRRSPGARGGDEVAQCEMTGELLRNFTSQPGADDPPAASPAAAAP